MKNEREILWTKPIPKGLRFNDKDLITLTKAEEEKLFSGKLNINDVIERDKKEKSVTKPRYKAKAAILTKGKKKVAVKKEPEILWTKPMPKGVQLAPDAKFLSKKQVEKLLGSARVKSKSKEPATKGKK